MPPNFTITGLFYQQQGYGFRRYLDIVRRNSGQQMPDVMVVMMNPGSSRPRNGNENHGKATEAVPDNTQHQIIRVMDNCNFNFARILNLSDIREPKSDLFYKKIKTLNNQQITHSIFDKARSSDYEKLFVKNIPVIFAWGVNKKLFPLAKTAMERMGVLEPIGLRKNGLDYAFYHPLPQHYTKQKEWVEKITEMIKKKQNNLKR